MTGHSNNNIQGDAIRWSDASLERTDAGYEEFTIRVREDTGGIKIIRCLGYIGFQMLGFWDEVIIETTTIHSDHRFIIDCESRVKALPETGSKTRRTAGNQLLEMILIDGCKLWVCAHQFVASKALEKST